MILLPIIQSLSWNIPAYRRVRPEAPISPELLNIYLQNFKPDELCIASALFENQILVSQLRHGISKTETE